MESINIAVIGANGVGKSHFIQRALSLSRPPGSQPSAARINIDHVPYAVSLFELDLEYFDVDPEKQIQWPRQVGGAMMPAIHGVLLLYDVMNRDSIIDLPQTLTALVNSSLPTVLVATKCDNPESARQIDTEGLATACKSCIANFKTSASKPESARMSLSTLLKALIIGRQDESGEATGRRRAASVAHLDKPFDLSKGRPLSQQSKHSRASSDMSLIKAFSQAVPGLDTYENAGDETTVSSMLRTPGIRLDKGATGFRDIDESDGESHRYSDDIPILQRNDDLNFDRPAKKAGVTFDDLVDRLIAPRFSRADSNFSDVFLCLYRKFAAPSELFSAILLRLERVKEDKSTHYLTKTATQLRIIESVAKWVHSYPGDFARPATRKNLEEFIRHLSTEPIFAAASQQMRRVLDLSVFEDDDSGWAKADDAGGSTVYASSTRVGSLSHDLAESMSSLNVSEPVDRRPSASSSLATDSTASTKVHQFQFHSYDDYEQEAATMVPSCTMPLTKFRYHIFMDTSDDDIADELTRIDWVMFSSIRIRDLVRHVSLSAQAKENTNSMKNVNRMVNHFNHIAKWVANMVLMRDKAKHRAQMLEKFMNIALKLRVLNNYNGLAAILAGINGTAVHRLTQTRNLVPADVQKRFARLVLLMGTQKSHFAYRLAWENSPLPRIPFMPLHRRDLVSAEEGSMTFVGQEGNRINWKKFEVLGEIILPIIKSQGTAYPNLTKHDTARELILDCLMPTDEEDIYQRSCQVENPGGGSFDGKKKFPWFAKQ
ncbi:ras guanine nucleotide exchange factor domain-containing protein [Truncatella angustata]|uniref:Ras guanine nucleotide exchange factor domain-containing protein n=1 Tax=Truncatella angustata TaxID=152316 RepID=A0A9P8RKN6_9PEZI|nr:ras guanine nucleotide exchange factor domain-containing protein [Truncatella angustata]KAH6645811.1 ras guanine nucleotide exchange factor domain-containing protein [Truncatella angustata]